MGDRLRFSSERQHTNLTDWRETGREGAEDRSRDSWGRRSAFVSDGRKRQHSTHSPVDGIAPAFVASRDHGKKGKLKKNYVCQKNRHTFRCLKISIHVDSVLDWNRDCANQPARIAGRTD